MITIKSNSTLNLFAPIASNRIVDNSVHTRSFDWYFPVKKTDSISAANDYPDSFCLIAVDKEDNKGISYGRLLYVANSLKEIDFYVIISGGFSNEILHYITGRNLT